MKKSEKIEELDKLIEIQKRLNCQVRQHFGLISSVSQPLSTEETQRARALIGDLQCIITELSVQQAVTARAMIDTFHNVNANLAYLNVGKSIKRDRQVGSV
jgi:hypothetical protein